MELMSMFLHDNNIPINLVMISGQQIKVLTAIDAVNIKNWNQRPTYEMENITCNYQNRIFVN